MQEVAKHYAHTVRLPVPLHTDILDRRSRILEWCIDNVGEDRRAGDHETGGIEFDTDAPWCHFGWVYYFKDPDHATCFRMVWG